MGTTKIVGTIVGLASCAHQNQVSQQVILKEIEIKNICLRANQQEQLILEPSWQDIEIDSKPGDKVCPLKFKNTSHEVYYAGFLKGVGYLYDIKNSNTGTFSTFVANKNNYKGDVLTEELYKNEIKTNKTVTFFKKYDNNKINLSALSLSFDKNQKPNVIIKKSMPQNSLFPFKHTLEILKTKIGNFVNLRIEEGETNYSNGKWYSMLITKDSIKKRNFFFKLKNGIFKIEKWKQKVDLETDFINNGHVSFRTFRGYKMTVSSKFKVLLKMNKEKLYNLLDKIWNNQEYKNHIIRHIKTERIDFLPIIKVFDPPLESASFDLNRIKIQRKGEVIENTDFSVFANKNLIIPVGSNSNIDLNSTKNIIRKKVGLFSTLFAPWINVAGSIIELTEEGEGEKEVFLTHEEQKNILKSNYISIRNSSYDVTDHEMVIEGTIKSTVGSLSLDWDTTSVALHKFIARTNLNLQFIKFERFEDKR